MPKDQKSGCLGILLASFLGRAKAKESTLDYPYGKRDAFLTPAEVSFFHVVQSFLPAEYHLVVKVRLADLFFVRQPHLNQAARNRIDRKHVDFLICDAKTMEPKLAIELDDRSHQRKDRQERDAFIDEVFRAAELPMVHIAAAKGYQVDEVRQVLWDAWPR